MPYGIFPAKDGSIVAACLTNSFWGRICNALAMPEYADDPRYDSLEKRRDAREEVNELVASRTREHTIDELSAAFEAHHVAYAPILGITEALAQPQAAARNLVVETEHQVLGAIPIVNRPFRFPGAEKVVPEAPPVLGQHTDDILGDVLGLAPERIAALRAAGVVA